MPQKLIRFNSKLNTNNIKKKNMFVGRVNGKDLHADYMVIENVSHMVSDAVMNRLLYGKGVFDALSNGLMKANARVPAPMSHPSDENGGFVDANDPITFPAHNIGAYDADWAISGDKLVSNTYIPVDSVNNPKPGNEWFSDRINNGLPIDRSTGLYLNVKESKGFGPDGEPYDYEVTEIFELNHSAILNPDIEPGAKNSGEGVGMFCNSKGDQVEIEEVYLSVNASTPAMQLPLANETYQWSASKALINIREYTGSNEQPSSNYRKFFLEFDQDDVGNFEAYKYPFADIIDGKPHAVKAPVTSMREVNEHAMTYHERFEEVAGDNGGFMNKALGWVKSIFSANELSHDNIHEKIYSKLNANRDPELHSMWPVDIFETYFVYRGDNDKLYEQSYIVAEDEVFFTKEPVEVIKETTYTRVFNNNNGDRIMRDKILAALLAANVKTDGLDDDALFAAYNGLTDQSGEDKSAANSAALTKQITDAVTNAVKPLQDQINANADKELDTAVAAVVAMNKGIDEAAAKAMGLPACNAFLAANGQPAFGAPHGQHKAPASDSCTSLKMSNQEL